MNGKFDVNLKGAHTELKFTSTLSETLGNLKSQFRLESAMLNLDKILPKKKANWTNQIFAWLGISKAMAVVSQPKTDFWETLSKNKILQGLDAKGFIDIKKLTYKETDFQNVQGDLIFQSLKLTLKQFHMAAFKGVLDMDGFVRLDTPKPSYVLSTDVKDFQLNPMLTMGAKNLKDVLFGELNADLKLEGAGFSFQDIEKNLKGKGKIIIEEAEMKGLNMGESLKEQLQLISIFAGSDILNENLESKIDKLQSSLIIQQGKLYTPDAVLEAKAYQAKMKGFASFQKDVNYTGELLVPKEKLPRSLASVADEKGRVAFPFMLSGKLPKPNFSVDVAGVARKAMQSQVKEKVQEKLKEKLGIDLPIELPF